HTCENRWIRLLKRSWSTVYEVAYAARRPRRRRQGGAHSCRRGCRPGVGRGSIGHRRVLCDHLHLDRRVRRPTVLGRLMSTLPRPLTLALRSATLAGYSALWPFT